eukprot:13307888-Alexandrium_andersonii.AAC.1
MAVSQAPALAWVHSAKTSRRALAQTLAMSGIRQIGLSALGSCFGRSATNIRRSWLGQALRRSTSRSSAVSLQMTTSGRHFRAEGSHQPSPRPVFSGEATIPALTFAT